MSEKISIFAPKYGLIPSVPSLLCDGAQRSCGNHQSFVIQNSDTAYSKQRIVRNTGLLYGRMLLTVWFNLWATRLTLANLGVDDLGVFGVVGSVVSMFAIRDRMVFMVAFFMVSFLSGLGGVLPLCVFIISLS